MEFACQKTDVCIHVGRETRNFTPPPRGLPFSNWATPVLGLSKVIRKLAGCTVLGMWCAAGRHADAGVGIGMPALVFVKNED